MMTSTSTVYTTRPPTRLYGRQHTLDLNPGHVQQDQSGSLAREPKARILLILTTSTQPNYEPSPNDIPFVLQDLQDGLKIAAYMDLVPGGKQYLSRSRVSTPQKLLKGFLSISLSLTQTDTYTHNDFMVSLDIESALFHVDIAESHRKYFSSHFAVQTFLKGTFIPTQSSGYWCCTNPKLSPTPSSSARPHVRHFYYQVIEWSTPRCRHAGLQV